MAGDNLKERYGTATLVKMNRRGRLQVKRSGDKIPSVHDLVYAESSPNYCVQNETMGVPGEFHRIVMCIVLVLLLDNFQALQVVFVIGHHRGRTDARLSVATKDSQILSRKSRRDARAGLFGVVRLFVKNVKNFKK